MMGEATSLRARLGATFNALHDVLGARQAMIRVRETGMVSQVGPGVARIRGLPSLKSEELVEFAGGVLGIALNLEADDAGVILLGKSGQLTAGSPARAAGRLADTPVGERLLGRVLDATGRALDGKGPLRSGLRWPIERDAPSIMDRAPVSVPLATGLKSVDALVPIGRGQRELIVGDRQTGKTAIAVDTILNQRDSNVICIYCAIGQRGTAVAKVVETLRQAHAMEYTIVVVAAGEDPPGLQFVTPYAATTMAEWFMERGRDVLIVYDDLTRHARAYRELSLLLRRPPGREAYPGDIFYIHSRMLERATHLKKERGGGSLTALPIVETQAQNLSAYIPTNLVSITDGQIYLSPELFHKGLLPAVDVGKSVSRVGGRTQLPAYREVAGDLRLAYSQFEELETFARFGTRLDDDTRAAIERGLRVREVIKQPENSPLAPVEQIAVMLAVNKGLFDALEPTDIGRAESVIRQAVGDDAMRDLVRDLESGEKLNEQSRKQLLDAIREALAREFTQLEEADKAAREGDNEDQDADEGKARNEDR
jgi:F-type H+-transporting ATPase subunit alpha